MVLILLSSNLFGLRICYDANPRKNREDNVKTHKEGSGRNQCLNKELEGKKAENIPTHRAASNAAQMALAAMSITK
jgi:hypothetical protein